MAKLLLSRSRSRSESKLGRKAKDAAKSSESLAVAIPHKFDAELLPSTRHVPRQMDGLVVEAYTSKQRSFDVSRPKTSGGSSATAKTEERPKTSHGSKKDSSLEEPNFSILNRSYTWSREQNNSKGKHAGSPMLTAFPPRPSSRQRDHPQSCEIGVAIGSPTFHPKTLSDARSSRMYGPEDLHSRPLPQHFISLDTPTNGHQADSIPVAEGKDSISKGSWKRFFGKSLFQKKTPQKVLHSQTLTSQTSITTVSSATYSGTQDTKDSMDSLREDSSVEEANEFDSEHKSKFEATPMLDVDIPKVEMERYSVMFDTLLNQQKPSIYARRKSGLHAVAAGQKISENPESTPALVLPKKKDNLPVGQLGLVNKSPLWLFPATPRTPKSPGRPRAMTTPTEMAGSLSATPEAATFKRPRPESDIVPSLLMMLEDRIERNALKAEKDPQTPFSVISEVSELDSPYSPHVDYENGVDNKAPWVRKFSMYEPEWEMITTPLRPRTPSPTEMDQSATEGEAFVAKAAKISIARQISISQRQLLLPVISNPERFVSRSKSTRSQYPKPEVSLVISPSRAESVSPAPTSAVATQNIAMAL
ncbi:hypothetical protein H072_8182 [Dactylellina haptotyla CBS 200.50]|uniref:Uncharacterized protein n=1 Tax=Dactylellina haptotyla (strain CBS 200.50) TaxID=1284197 RepID=S8A5K9_DACHA|nr:hypothetical protein H072_8182 [Dactylellina haptotyla CBS 200.50]